MQNARTAVVMRWFFSDRFAKTIIKPITTKPMARVMRCSLENGWNGIAGILNEAKCDQRTETKQGREYGIEFL